MLAMSDIDLNIFIPIFADLNLPVAFLVPTPTGYFKSIMDATAPVRELLKEQNIHDYISQKQGPDHKVLIETFFVHEQDCTETTTSLYRPITKQGDPRIWFKDLKKYCQPRNLLAILVINQKLHVINLSNKQIAQSLFQHDFVYNLLLQASNQQNIIAQELLSKLRLIHQQGFIPTIYDGDLGVGATLEHALGIKTNNLQLPDYKGIELKATRLSINGQKRNITRSTLFTKVPDEGLTYREIVDLYGKIQTPKNSTVARLQLYDTLKASHPNTYDLLIQVDQSKEKLLLLHAEYPKKAHFIPSGTYLLKNVSAWLIQNLKNQLITKHHETFWVQAEAIRDQSGIEKFRYDLVSHTRQPNTSLLIPLFETDKITIDLAAHYNPDGSWRDHGILFKMKPKDLPLLLGTPKVYRLDQ